MTLKRTGTRTGSVILTTKPWAEIECVVCRRVQPIADPNTAGISGIGGMRDRSGSGTPGEVALTYSEAELIGWTLDSRDAMFGSEWRCPLHTIHGQERLRNVAAHLKDGLW